MLAGSYCVGHFLPPLSRCPGTEARSAPGIKVEHLNEHDLRLFALADQKLPDLARRHNDALAVKFTELRSTDDPSIARSGFTTREIDKILQRAR